MIDSTVEGTTTQTGRRRFPWAIFFGVVGIALVPNIIPLFLKKHNTIWPMQNLSNMLESKVFGQKEAIRTLTYALDELFLRNESGVIFLTGPVGVGKTLASSLIQEEYPWKGDMYFEFADSLVFKDFRKPLFKNLLIIEDCNERNRQNTISTIRSFLAHAKTTNKELIILSIFTHQTENEITSFLELATKLLNNFNHVPFKNLDRDSIKKCIEKFINSNQMKIDESVVEKIVDKQMEHGEGNLNPGCKQIDALIIKLKSVVRRPFDNDDD